MADRPFTVYETSSSLNYQNVGNVSVDSNASFDYYLEGRSFHTFTCGYNHIPKISLEAVPTPGQPLLRDYTFTLIDEDGIEQDMKKAGIAFFLGNIELGTIYYDDPWTPDFFHASIDSGGTVLTLKLTEVPQNLGALMIGGGVDIDGGLGLKFSQI
jgi:hypothetical protein